MKDFVGEDGRKLIKIARKSIRDFLKGEKVLTEEELEDENQKYSNINRGVFVTLKNNQGELRGCIGRPYPDQNLLKAIIDSSISATRDPRFQPVSEDELKNILIEVTVLTEPEEIEIGSEEEAMKKIELGEDGLIIKGKYGTGLLLPQVVVDNDWNELEFLDYTCTKAGLRQGCWKEKETRILKFQGHVFNEKNND